MAKYDNPQKGFTFGVIAPGLNPYSVQEVDLPDVDFDELQHGESNHMIKTAGMIKYGDGTLNKLLPAVGSDNWIWAWVTSIQDGVSGGGQIPSAYKRNIRVVQYAPDGINIVAAWDWIGAWPKKINGLKLSKTKSENVMQEITFAMDMAVKVI